MPSPIPENLTNDEKDVLEQFQKLVGNRFGSIDICVDQGRLMWIKNTHNVRGPDLRTRKLRESKHG